MYPITGQSRRIPITIHGRRSGSDTRLNGHLPDSGVPVSPGVDAIIGLHNGVYQRRSLILGSPNAECRPAFMPAP